MASSKAPEIPIQNLTVSDTKKLLSDTDESSDSGFATPVTEPSQTSTLTSTQASSAQTSTSTAQSSGPPSDDTEQPEGPIRTPFARPLPSCKPVPRPELTAEQAPKYEALHKLVSSWEKIPVSTEKKAREEPLTEDERMWLTRECLLRYLRATNWSPTDAPKRLMNTMVWRREYNVKDITGDLVSEESETGKQHILGFDINARPCLYMNPGKQNTQKSERQIQHLVFMLEKVIDMMPPGQETTALLINFKGATSGGSPSVAQGRQVLNILQNHYPERLGRACISELPWYINTFFKLISPFIDPVTKEKMIFNQDLRKHVPPAQLDKEHGGDADFEYDHAIYWPALNKMCDERRAAMKERWVKGGSRIGEFEAYLRGGDHKSLTEHQSGLSEVLPSNSDSDAVPLKV